MRSKEIQIKFSDSSYQKVKVALYEPASLGNTDDPHWVKMPSLSSHILKVYGHTEFRVLGLDPFGEIVSKSRYPSFRREKGRGEFHVAAHGASFLVGLPKAIFNRIRIGDKMIG